jgi:ankyrin repeat protein
MKLLVKHGAAVKGETLIAALALDEWAQGKALDVLLTTRLEPGATATALAQGFAVQPHVVKRLVAKGVDWGWHNGEDDEALPLITAAERGDRDFVRALLDVGAPVDMRTKSGRTALGVAIDATAASGSGGGSPDHARVIELLVARGADVNRRFPDGRTPLYAAAESGDIRVINALLERGARVNEVVLDSLPIDAAEQYGHEPAARVLHAHGGRRARKSNMGD